jgi:hypothetical protein
VYAGVECGRQLPGLLQVTLFGWRQFLLIVRDKPDHVLDPEPANKIAKRIGTESGAERALSAMSDGRENGSGRIALAKLFITILQIPGGETGTLTRV